LAICHCAGRRIRAQLVNQPCCNAAEDPVKIVVMKESTEHRGDKLYDEALKLGAQYRRSQA